MTAWTAVKLTEARQVEALIGDDEDRWPAPEVSVRERFDALRAARDLSGACVYLAHALPRFETVAWAAHVLDDQTKRGAAISPRARHALDTALRWIDDPTDSHRRSARRAADAIGKPGPEYYLGLAVFYSGGSASPAGMAPALPPPHACARFAAAAMTGAANRTADADACLARVLALGEAVAERGLEALKRS